MRIILGIGGGIAAYKTPDLVRRLRERGHEVRCVITANAGRLVAKDALATVSGAAVRDSLWQHVPGPSYDLRVAGAATGGSGGAAPRATAELPGGADHGTSGPGPDGQRHEGGIDHIDLPRWAEGLVVAPATADLLGKFAHGIADDLLTTLFLALEPAKPVWLCPAMNTVMWYKPQVQANFRLLCERGARSIGPVGGNLACGETGMGAMSDPTAIAAAIA